MSSEAGSGDHGRRRKLERHRCACSRCGAETVTDVGMRTVAGNCGVCGSWELVVLDHGQDEIECRVPAN